MKSDSIKFSPQVYISQWSLQFWFCHVTFTQYNFHKAQMLYDKGRYFLSQS